MKIGVLTGTFHPETGGPPTYLYHLLPALIERGHEVCVVTFGAPDAAAHDYGYPVTRISRGSQGRFIAYLRAAWALARWSDTLFVMGYVLPLLALRPFYRRRIVAKIVSDFVWEYADRRKLTTLDVIAFQTARLPLRLAVLRILHRAAVRCADVIITPSDHVARLVNGWGARRVQVIHNAIPETDLHTVERAVLRQQLSLPLDKTLLVSVARLTPVKGVDVAVRALAMLPESVEMVVVGEGAQLPELQALAPPGRVHFVGRQEHDITLRYLRAANIFVLSSHTEGLSHVLLEALSVGTPAVATAVGGNPEILTDGVNGLLVPPNDPAQLAAAIDRVRLDPLLAENLATAGIVRSADFSWENTVNQTEALLVEAR